MPAVPTGERIISWRTLFRAHETRMRAAVIMYISNDVGGCPMLLIPEMSDNVQYSHVTRLYLKALGV